MANSNTVLTLDTSQDATFANDVLVEGDLTSGSIRINEATNPNLQLYRSSTTTQLWELSIDSSGRLLVQEAASEGGTQYTRMQIDDPGNVTFNAYGSGSFTGTTANLLAVDSSGNVIETSTSGEGIVTGSGTAEYLSLIHI